MKKIILFGAGGHAAVIIDILKAQIKLGEDIEIVGFLDDSDKVEWMGYPVIGTLASALAFNDKDTEFIIAIGNNLIREMLHRKFPQLKFRTAIHPTATIGSSVTIEEGTVIMPNVVVNANSQIGRHVILNTGVIVEHDNIIGDYTHLSPGATLCGSVMIGSKTHIGANATVIQGVPIGEQCIIGAGSTVITHIPNYKVAVGTPAKVIKEV